MASRRPFILRLDPELHETLQRWARDELRSLNAQIEFLLRRAVEAAGREPPSAPPPPASPASPTDRSRG